MAGERSGADPPRPSWSRGILGIPQWGSPTASVPSLGSQRDRTEPALGFPLMGFSASAGKGRSWPAGGISA